MAPCPIDIGPRPTTVVHAFLDDDSVVHNERAERCLETVASNLNLKCCFGSDCEQVSVPLYVGWEAQVHMGEDDRLYLHHCARAMPADMPRSHIEMQVRLLRPEALQQFSEPVSANASPAPDGTTDIRLAACAVSATRWTRRALGGSSASHAEP